jgi:predicted nucleic acid-binding protein
VTVFVDASVILYSAEPSPSYAGSRAIVGAIVTGDIQGRTSTAVLEEVWHVESRGRSGALTGITRRAYGLFAPLLPVTDDTFRRALELDGLRMGTNDRLHVATCLENQIDTIVTADADFDAVPGLRRVDPLDPDALERLRAAAS